MQEGCQGQSVPLWACVKLEREEEEGKEENGLNWFTQLMLVSTMAEPGPAVSGGPQSSAGLEIVTSE